jgi:HEAT repeat protein
VFGNIVPSFLQRPLVRWGVAAVVMFFSCGTRPAPADDVLSQKRAWAAIVRPRAHTPYWGDDDMLQQAFAECWTELLYLSSLPGDLEDRLVSLAEKGNPAVVRFRAAVVLMMRGSGRGLEILSRWTSSKEAIERLMAWKALGWYCGDIARAEESLPARTAIARLSDELNENVRRHIVSWFGHRKIREAVEVLCRAARSGGRHGEDAIHALGQIGDPRAAADIVNSQCSRHIRFLALGRIGGPEAVDYLGKNLDSPAAVYALGETGDRAGIPALKARLEQLEERKRALERATTPQPARAELDALNTVSPGESKPATQGRKSGSRG